MKKMLIIIVTILCMTIQLSSVNATSTDEAIIDTITCDPWTVYTVYLGMPTEQFVNNFSRLYDWTNTEYKRERSLRGKPKYSVEYKRNHSGETVRVSSLVNGGVISCTNVVYGDSSYCFQLATRGMSNLEKKFKTEGNIDYGVDLREVDLGIVVRTFCARWMDYKNERMCEIAVYKPTLRMMESYSYVQITRCTFEAVNF